jgi:glutamine cyclotransferase
MKKLRVYLAIILVVIAMVCYLIPFNSCNNGPPPPDDSVKTNPVPAFQTNILNSFPHDTSSFTEGFLVYKGFIYESTGENGRSKLLKIDPTTWKIVKEISLGEKYFGEGISIVHDTIYQMTYQQHTVFVYDLNFNKKREMYFDTDNHEGWGMTTDGTNLIVSDGSSSLQYFEPTTFHLLKRVTVTEAGVPVPNVNELELIDGFIYANQWQLIPSYIFKIDPATGNVIAKTDITNIWDQTTQLNDSAVPNGIAYDSTSKKIYITGKNWPKLYEVRFQ